MTKLTALTPIAILALVSSLVISGCSDESEKLPSSSPNASENTDEDPVTALKSLPVFPSAQLSDGTPIKGEYPADNPVAPNLTGFYVASDSTTVEDIESFFANELPGEGWQEEGPPWVLGKEGTSVETVIYQFVRDNVRLTIQIPLVHKDEPRGVRVVNLLVAPKDENPFASPIATGIDSTPPPTPTFEPEVTPPGGPSDMSPSAVPSS